ncbi:MAG TPA: hypothetical protein VEN81_01075 [Planctomycetota bacterium]|nr:hypothetical protein [Planctomycetota bacterium]
MYLTAQESEIAWSALQRGLITFADVDSALQIQAREVREGRRQPRSLAIILIALGRLEDTDLVGLLHGRAR